MKRNIFRLTAAAVTAFFISIPAFAAKTLIPVGKVVGLSLAEGSVTVVAYDDTLGAPARDAGLKIGDDIVDVDGKTVDSASDLHEALKCSDGRVTLTVCRNDKEHQLSICPTPTQDGPRLGVFIREGVTGIGTVTYYDPDSGCFGALGHGVSSSRGALAPMITGNMYRASVASVKAGRVGNPGQLKGAVAADQTIGTLQSNTAFGIFGSCQAWSGEALPVAKACDVKTGPAQIMSNISGDAVEVFSVEIVKVFSHEPSNGRDLMLQITDPALLEATGGIVAGMSGSPIIQNGQLVGAVTHVLVNQPDTGYGIFIENMLQAAG